MEEVRLALDRDQLAFLRSCELVADEPEPLILARICAKTICLPQAQQRAIFGKIRCRKCGRKFVKTELTWPLPVGHISWLEQIVATFQIKDLGKAIRILIDYLIAKKQG
jgi:hypothetical protein